jgi:hypothetical protein
MDSLFMKANNPKVFPASAGSEFRRVDEEMVELSLLIPSSQAKSLEQEARRRGISAGELIRHLIRDFFLNPTARIGIELRGGQNFWKQSN